MSTVHTTNQLGKVHNLKVEGIVSFDGVPEDFNPEGRLSGSSEGLLPRLKKEPGCVGFCNKNQVIRNIKRLLLIKENQASQLNEFSAFLCSGFNMQANLENSAVPQDWKRSVFIPIPKKGNAKECSNCHTIALMSHGSRRRQWHPSPVLLPGKSHGWRSLVGCSP